MPQSTLHRHFVEAKSIFLLFKERKSTREKMENKYYHY